MVEKVRTKIGVVPYLNEDYEEYDYFCDEKVQLYE